LPIACSLDASTGSERLARWRALAANGAPSVERAPRELVIRFADAPRIMEELEELAAAERECCAFAEWRVARGPRCAELHIRSRPEGLEAIAALLASPDLVGARPS
jgi:hypothetical protein